MIKKENPTLYSYCIPIDDGAAPNPYWGICTLTICKPVIRRVAEIGDLVVGTGSKNSPIGDISKHVVYAMKITGKMTLEEYDKFCREKYPNKIPDWDSREFPHRVGDCIYDFSEGYPPKMRGGVHNEGNMETDLGGENALISRHFYYFGDQPKKLPDNLHGIIKQGRGHRSKSNMPYVDEFISWIKGPGYKPKKIYGEPQLKKKIMKDPKYVSKCSEIRCKEAEEDERIGIECE